MKEIWEVENQMLQAGEQWHNLNIDVKQYKEIKSV